MKKNRHLRLFYHRGSDGKTNFGDELSPLLLEYVTKNPVSYSDLPSCDVIGLGSLLSKVFRVRYQYLVFSRLNILRRTRPIVWGTGFIRECTVGNWKHLDIRSVRGAKTAKILDLNKVTFGDPGLLVGDYFQERHKRHQIGLVPHISDIDTAAVGKFIERFPDVKLILPTKEPTEVLRAISECEIIFSSSLHGLIVADAFQIPNFRVTFGDRIAGGDFKFLDYASSLNRNSIMPIDFNAFALDEEVAKLDCTYQSNIPRVCAEIRAAIGDLSCSLE